MRVNKPYFFYFLFSLFVSFFPLPCAYLFSFFFFSIFSHVHKMLGLLFLGLVWLFQVGFLRRIWCHLIGTSEMPSTPLFLASLGLTGDRSIGSGRSSRRRTLTSLWRKHTFCLGAQRPASGLRVCHPMLIEDLLWAPRWTGGKPGNWEYSFVLGPVGPLTALFWWWPLCSTESKIHSWPLLFVLDK